MIGPLLIVIGLILLWTAFRGKAGPMWDAITGQSGFSINLNSLGRSDVWKPFPSNGSGGSQTGSGNAPDSGSHMGIDSNGNIISIDKPYGSMTPEEKDAANNYAHQIGNVG